MNATERTMAPGWAGHPHGHGLYRAWLMGQRHPWVCLLCMSSLGIALVPAALALVLGASGSNWAGAPPHTRATSAYLAPATSEAHARTLRMRIEAWPEVAGVRLITAQQADTELRKDPNWQPVLDALPDNPLPATLVINPEPATAANPEAMRALTTRLEQLPEMAMVQTSQQSGQPLQHALHVLHRVLTLMWLLLTLGACLTMSLVVRQATRQRTREIEVMHLLGSSPTLIRQPILIGAALVGLCAGSIALGLAMLLIHWLFGQFGGMPAFDAWFKQNGWISVWPGGATIVFFLVSVTAGCTLIARVSQSAHDLPWQRRRN